MNRSRLQFLELSEVIFRLEQHRYVLYVCLRSKSYRRHKTRYLERVRDLFQLAVKNIMAVVNSGHGVPLE